MVIDNIVLPNFHWIDEFEWCSVRQSKNYSITGSLFVQESAVLSGRDITFSGTDNSNLITRSQLVLLKASQNTLNKTFTITLADDRSFTVRWRNSDGMAVEVTPFISHSYNNNNLYVVKALKFMEVA